MYLQTMKNIVLLILFICSRSYGDIKSLIDTTGSINIHLKNEGTIGGKTNSEFLQPQDEPLNNHGFFYTGSSITFLLMNTITMNMCLRVWNEELSVFDRYKYLFEPEVALSFKKNKLETLFRGGYINNVTLGSGLTVKDFSNSGAIVKAQWKKLLGSAGIFSRGYGSIEDLYWVTLGHKIIPFELTMLCMNTQGTEINGLFGSKGYYITSYLLPNLSFKINGGLLYAEYGFKLNAQKNAVDIIEESPQKAHAGLVGFKTDHHGRRLTLNGCLELRAYQKGFIPVTGVDLSRFNNFWDEDDSRANWIDFFDSRETSYWVYLRIDADCRVYGRWYIFVRDEILYFYSKQKEAVIYPSYDSALSHVGAIVQYKPSSHYYKIGIKFVFIRGVSAEVSIGNKLINNWGLYDSPYSQWGQRFIATNYPFGETRIIWNF